jgi:biopolymer transport protein ExbD
MTWALLEALQDEKKMIAKSDEPTQDDYDKVFLEHMKIGNLRRATLNAQDRNNIPHLKDFLQLYPDSVVRYIAMTGAHFPSLSVTTKLHGRYELRMDVPVQYTEDHLKIAGYGQPSCYLEEVASVITRDDGAGGTELSGTEAGSLQKHFGLKEWEALVGSKGDFSVIGCELNKDNPVPNFDLVIRVKKSFEQEPTIFGADVSALLDKLKEMPPYKPDPKENLEPPTIPVIEEDVQPSKKLPEKNAESTAAEAAPVPDAKRNSEENAAAKPVEPGTVINILADGTIRIGGGKVDLTQLHEKLASMAAQNKNQPVVIRGDGEVSYKRVVEVIDTCQKAGMWNISFATQ